MHSIPILSLAALLPLAAPLPQAAPDVNYAQIEAYLDERFEATGIPGAAYAIIDLEGETLTAAWGEDGDGEPVATDTPFLWGSVAKPVTSTAVMTLVEDGLLDLDAPVVDYLPDFRLSDPDTSDRITLRHLLEQSSGIPEGSGITDRYDEVDDPYGEAVADLAGVDPRGEPGEAFEYASANYLVVGAVIEAVTGEPFEAYLREAVLDPLGMDEAVATAEDAAAVPPGHAVAFGQAVPIETRFDPTGPSYGYLGGSVEDLAAFAEAMLAGGGVVTPESVALMHTGAAEVSDTIDYGLGWRVDERNADLGTTTVWHTGGTPGFTAGVILLPELGKAVAVAQNQYGYFQDGALVGTMLGAARLLAGGEPAELESDPLYATILAVLSALVLAAFGFAVWTVTRIVGARKSSREVGGRVRTVVTAVLWLVAAGALAYAVFVFAPGMAPSREAFFLLLPDVAWLATALGVTFALLAVLRVWYAALRLRRV